MLDLKGRWVLVTGASRGIGRLAAKAMAKHGCNLILQSRNVKHTASLEEEIKAFGAEVHSFAADLNDVPSVLKMLEEIDALGVDVDIVLNNAGLQIAYRTDYCQTPAEDFTVSFNVNTIAPAMICYHFLPKMVSRGFGRIVNTTPGIALSGALGALGPPRSVLHQPGSARFMATPVPPSLEAMSFVILSSAAFAAE